MSILIKLQRLNLDTLNQCNWCDAKAKFRTISMNRYQYENKTHKILFYCCDDCGNNFGKELVRRCDDGDEIRKVIRNKTTSRV